MTIRSVLLASVVLPALCAVAVPPQVVRLDIQASQRPFSLRTAAGTEPLIRTEILNGGAAYPVGGWTGVLYYATSAASTQVVAISSSASVSNLMDFQVSASEVAATGTYFAQVLLSDGTNTVEWSRGTLTVLASPGSSGAAQTNWGPVLNWDLISSFLGTPPPMTVAVTNEADPVAYPIATGAAAVASAGYTIATGAAAVASAGYTIATGAASTAASALARSLTALTNGSEVVWLESDFDGPPCLDSSGLSGSLAAYAVMTNSLWISRLAFISTPGVNTDSSWATLYMDSQGAAVYSAMSADFSSGTGVTNRWIFLADGGLLFPNGERAFRGNNAAGLTNFPSSVVTITNFQQAVTNHLRFLTTLTAPTGATASGSRGEVRTDATNLYIYTTSNRWFRLPGTYSWP